MKTSIAVFDERLFEKITTIKQSEISAGDWWTEIINQYEDIEQIKTKLIQKWKDNKFDSSSAYLLENKENADEIKEFMGRVIPLSKERIERKIKTPFFNKLKGIFFFNIIWVKEEFVVYGYDDVEFTKEKEFNCVIYRKIATISNKDSFKIEIHGDKKFEYDYICIHQGLLDKIYEKFHITDKAKKIIVTKEIYKKFSKKDASIVEKYNYLPQLIIHSGRGKPGENEMPQCQPFLQFSALENAIMDCKYSLVELLDMAHYEQG
jgi:chloramphenicol O-acetyltransferase